MTATHFLFWLHDEALALPEIYRKDYGNYPACYIFDSEYIKSQAYGLKRLTFIHECLQDSSASLYKGSFHATLLALTAATNSGIITVEPVCPELQKVITTLKTSREITLLERPPLVHLPAGSDLTRFARYWKKAERQLFKPTPML
jgi:hypothetical protein